MSLENLCGVNAVVVWGENHIYVEIFGDEKPII
jgi:hypothetical protein